MNPRIFASRGGVRCGSLVKRTLVMGGCFLGSGLWWVDVFLGGGCGGCRVCNIVAQSGGEKVCFLVQFGECAVVVDNLIKMAAVQCHCGEHARSSIWAIRTSVGFC